jgi:hypothetical protein
MMDQLVVERDLEKKKQKRNRMVGRGAKVFNELYSEVPEHSTSRSKSNPSESDQKT